jgi:peptidoglycan/xylan/chitin deacetylase (PgdA/CDA1 family)
MSFEHALLRLTKVRTFVSCTARLVHWGALSQGPSKRREVALTFDDGPDPRFTPRVLDALDQAEIRATFFVVGTAVEAHPELVREARRRGHEIRTHLFSHARETVFDDAAFERELSRSKSALEDLLGVPLRWLRFPYGERGAQRCRDIQQRYGVRAAHWTYSSHDSRAQNPLDVRTRVAVGLRPGAIVLLHDALADADRVQAPYVADRSATVLALPHIGTDLRANRLRGVTLSELMR